MKESLKILIVGSLLVLLIAVIYRDYGVSYDEVVHLNNGDWIMVWYGTMGKVDSAVTATSSRFYAGMADILTQALSDTGTILFGWDHFEERHFINALIGLLGVLYTYRLGRLLGGSVVGGWAALILLVTPRWFGHMFDNPKDIPFATGYVAALFYILQPVISRRGYDWRSCIKIGLSIGAALGVRIGGLFLYLTFGLSILLWVAASSIEAGDEGKVAWVKRRDFTFWGRLIKGNLLHYVPRLFLVWILSWTMMVLVWPYALLSPLVRPFQVMEVMSHYPWPGEIFFQGQAFPAADVPSLYLPTWLLITLPEFYFLGLLLGFGVLIRHCLKRRISLFQLSPYLVLAFSILFPVWVIVVRHSTVYDGMRHVLFTLPPLAVCTATGILAFWRDFPAKASRGFVVTALGLSLALTVYDLISLHPYQTVYFNRLFAGGLKQGLTRFNGDYWGQTYHAGSDWIVAHYPSETLTIGVPYMAKRLGYYFDRKEEIQSRQRMLRCWLTGKTYHAAKPIPRLRVVGPDWDGVSCTAGNLFWDGKYQLFMSGSEFQWNQKVPGKTLFTITRQGALLLEIKEVEGGTP